MKLKCIFFGHKFTKWIETNIFDAEHLIYSCKCDRCNKLIIREKLPKKAKITEIIHYRG